MNHSILSRMIQSTTGSNRHVVAKGSATRANEEKQQAPKTIILRIGTHSGRHNRWLDRMLKNTRPGDLVVLQYGGNYCQFDWPTVAAHPDIDHLPLLSFGQFREFFTTAIAKARAKGANVALLTLPTLLPQRYFSLVCRNLDRQAILHWLGDDACALNQWNEKYNDEIQSLGAQFQLPVIDINPAFLQHHYLDDCYAPDGMHPNAVGRSVIAELVADWQRTHC